jgi:hypothetical protein
VRIVACAAIKKTIRGTLREVLLLFVPIDFRLPLAAVHNLQPVCRLIEPGGVACPQADLAQERVRIGESRFLEAAPFCEPIPSETVIY